MALDRTEGVDVVDLEPGHGLQPALSWLHMLWLILLTSGLCTLKINNHEFPMPKPYIL